MVSFAALPPEVNSGLMYSGGGSGPMVSAATAWDRLAAELGSAATSYREVISELTDGGWQGPSAEAMAAAAAPYVEWMNVTAAQAAQTASQVRSAAAAYEAAFTATVPPQVIAANRALLSSLVSTNTFGQNTAAIAANQAQYAEMWAQDATAMYSYAGHAAAAVQLTPFSAAPQETNPAAAAAQAAQAAGPPTSTVPNALQALSAGAFDPLALVIDFTTSPLMSALNGVGTLGVPFIAAAAVTFDSAAIIFYTFELMLTAARAAGGYWGSAAAAAAGADSAGGGAFAVSDVAGLPVGALGSTLASSSESAIGAGVSAGLGRAAEVGGLSVPQSWAGGSDIRLAARALPAAGLAGLPQVGAAAPGLAGMGGLGGAPILGSVVNASRNGDTHSRHGARSKLVSSLPGAAGESPQRSGRPAASARVVARPLSEHDRNEREKLREEIAELALERDAAARLIREAMQP